MKLCQFLKRFYFYLQSEAKPTPPYIDLRYFSSLFSLFQNWIMIYECFIPLVMFAKLLYIIVMVLLGLKTELFVSIKLFIWKLTLAKTLMFGPVKKKKHI